MTSLSSAFMRSETLTASYRVWTRFTDFISFDDNRYTKRVLSEGTQIELLWVCYYSFFSHFFIYFFFFPNSHFLSSVFQIFIFSFFFFLLLFFIRILYIPHFRLKVFSFFLSFFLSYYQFFFLLDSFFFFFFD